MAYSTSSLGKFFEAVADDNIDEVVEILKLKEIDINVRNKDDAGQTALHIAAKYGNEKLVRILVDDYDADINLEDIRGDTPLKVACDNYFPNIAKYLVGKDAKDAPYAERILNDESIDEYFKAADQNDVTKVKELLDNGKVRVDDVDKTQYHRSALQAAAKYGHLELVALLIEKYKANINWSDDIGDRAIHMAADNGHVDIAKYLADRGSMNVEDIEHLF